MEREKEKDLLKELNELRAQVQDQKARRDNLLRLVQKLQKIQSSGPPARGARSVSLERANVAQAVAKYLTNTESPVIPADVSGSIYRVQTLKSGEHLVLSAKGLYSVCACARRSSHLEHGSHYLYFGTSIEKWEFVMTSVSK